MTAKIRSLYIYPVKSCRGLKANLIDADQRGFIGDRRAMIVDSSGMFLTQRSHSRMAQISTVLNDGNLQLKLNENQVSVTWSKNRQLCTIWNDQVDLLVADTAVNDALSDYLETSARLVLMDNQSSRSTSGTWAVSDLNLSDGYPVLVTNTASLMALSDAAGIPLSMLQFRPNIVIEHDEAWAEDQWKVIRIGDVEIELVKPCTRCQVTTLDPETGEASYPETMAAMIRHRMSGDPRVKGVLFGWNAVFRKTGRLQSGNDVEIIETRKSWSINKPRTRRGVS